jgi:membrane-associated protein
MFIIDWILHLDQHLAELAVSLGPWLYGLLFGIVFCETGLIVMPFLPGDSLLFAVGALAANESSQLNLGLLLILLVIAAVLGDAVNYWIGRVIGPKIFRSENSRILNKKHLLRAQHFYEKHGGKAVLLARFLPILRTFAPFVAGIGKMNYLKFWMYNVTGGVLWVGMFLIGGYVFGTRPWVKDNFHYVIIAIIVLSCLPIAFEWYRAMREAKRESTPA